MLGLLKISNVEHRIRPYIRGNIGSKISTNTNLHHLHHKSRNQNLLLLLQIHHNLHHQ